MSKPMNNISSIVALQYQHGMPHIVKEWREINQVAIGSNEQCILAHLGEHPRKMHTRVRHEYIEKDSLC